MISEIFGLNLLFGLAHLFSILWKQEMFINTEGIIGRIQPQNRICFRLRSLKKGSVHQKDSLL